MGAVGGKIFRVSDTVRSGRWMDRTLGASFMFAGIAALIEGADAYNKAFGPFLIGLGVVMLRTRQARIVTEGLEVRHYLSTRIYRWEEIAAVRVERWWPYHLLRIHLSNNRDVQPEGLGTWRRKDSPLHQFAARANALAKGPPQRSQQMSPRVKWFFALAFMIALLTLSITTAMGS